MTNVNTNKEMCIRVYSLVSTISTTVIASKKLGDEGVNVMYIY
jgi:hypothetical protein